MKFPLLIFLSFLFVLPSAAQSGDELTTIIATVVSENRFVSSLTAKDFELFVNGEQTTFDFAKPKDEPASIVLLADVSASMKSLRNNRPVKFFYPLEGFRNFVRKANPQNEYSVITFSKNVTTILEPTQDQAAFEKALAELEKEKFAVSETRYYDAVIQALEKLKKAKYRNRILMIISDGNEFPDKKIEFIDVKRTAATNSAQIYFMRVFPDDSTGFSPELISSIKRRPVLNRDVPALRSEMLTLTLFPGGGFPESLRFLTELSEITGGRGYFPLDRAETDRCFENFAEELMNQYRLKPDPTAFPKRNRSNEIKLRLAKGSKLKKVQVRTRSEIYF